MRAWFVQGEPSRESDALGSLLQQWASLPENRQWEVACVPWTPEASTQIETGCPEVLLLTQSFCPGSSWLGSILEQGTGLVVASSAEHAGPYRLLAEQYPVQLMPQPATLEDFDLALLNLVASLQRQRGWQTRIDQLQQRLNDRILVERAKGILVEQLAISEKEAYQRLRLQSRRQRRPIRDIAQSLLDAQTLFAPTQNGMIQLPGGQAHSLVEESSQKSGC